MPVTQEHIALASQFQMFIHQRQKRGQNGHVLGRGAGSSTDYLDHRRYVLGDDIRRLDWKAYARTDQLLIKRYQEEIRPVVEIWYDDSASMMLSAQKAQLTIDMTGFLAQVCRRPLYYPWLRPRKAVAERLHSSIRTSPRTPNTEFR